LYGRPGELPPGKPVVLAACVPAYSGTIELERDQLPRDPDGILARSWKREKWQSDLCARWAQG